MFLESPKCLLSKRLEILKDRSLMLRRSREFFSLRDILEVDCPILSPSASVDTHIDLIPAHPKEELRYLHSSPEYGMKRLLSEGIGDIYQLSHVFRNGEYGIKHNPEFTMAEWYRVGYSFSEMIDETVAYIRCFLGDLPFKIVSYRDVFLQFLGFDYLKASSTVLLEYMKEKNINIYSDIDPHDRDELLNLILGNLIEPHLGQDELFVLAYYPASQAALAKTCFRGEEHVCERFEIYYQGTELANGYHELADPIEQRKRIIEANEKRKKMGKETLPMDENFVQSLEKGLPNCCGVAVGFDRLMMLRHNSANIAEVIPFHWENA